MFFTLFRALFPVKRHLGGVPIQREPPQISPAEIMSGLTSAATGLRIREFYAPRLPAVRPALIPSIPGQAGGGTTSVAAGQIAACGFSPARWFPPATARRANVPPPAGSRWPASPSGFRRGRAGAARASRPPGRAGTFHPREG